MRDSGPTWLTYVLAVWWTYSAFLVVKGVGKPREPITRTTAIGAVVIVVLMVSAIAIVGA